MRVNENGSWIELEWCLVNAGKAQVWPNEEELKQMKFAPWDFEQLSDNGEHGYCKLTKTYRVKRWAFLEYYRVPKRQLRSDTRKLIVPMSK